MDGYDRNAGHPDQRKGGYIAHVANVEPYPDTPPDASPGQLPFGKDPEEAYDKGYYIWVVNTADGDEPVLAPVLQLWPSRTLLGGLHRAP